MDIFGSTYEITLIIFESICHFFITLYRVLTNQLSLYRGGFQAITCACVPNTKPTCQQSWTEQQHDQVFRSCHGINHRQRLLELLYARNDPSYNLNDFFDQRPHLKRYLESCAMGEDETKAEPKISKLVNHLDDVQAKSECNDNCSLLRNESSKDLWQQQLVDILKIIASRITDANTDHCCDFKNCCEELKKLRPRTKSPIEKSIELRKLALTPCYVCCEQVSNATAVRATTCALQKTTCKTYCEQEPQVPIDNALQLVMKPSTTFNCSMDIEREQSSTDNGKKCSVSGICNFRIQPFTPRLSTEFKEPFCICPYQQNRQLEESPNMPRIFTKESQRLSRCLATADVCAQVSFSEVFSASRSASISCFTKDVRCQIPSYMADKGVLVQKASPADVTNPMIGGVQSMLEGDTFAGNNVEDKEAKVAENNSTEIYIKHMTDDFAVKSGSSDSMSNEEEKTLKRGENVPDRQLNGNSNTYDAKTLAKQERKMKMETETERQEEGDREECALLDAKSEENRKVQEELKAEIERVQHEAELQLQKERDRLHEEIMQRQAEFDKQREKDRLQQEKLKNEVRLETQKERERMQAEIVRRDTELQEQIKKERLNFQTEKQEAEQKAQMEREILEVKMLQREAEMQEQIKIERMQSEKLKQKAESERKAEIERMQAEMLEREAELKKQMEKQQEKFKRKFEEEVQQEKKEFESKMLKKEAELEEQIEKERLEKKKLKEEAELKASEAKEECQLELRKKEMEFNLQIEKERLQLEQLKTEAELKLCKTKDECQAEITKKGLELKSQLEEEILQQGKLKEVVEQRAIDAKEESQTESTKTESELKSHVSKERLQQKELIEEAELKPIEVQEESQTELTNKESGLEDQILNERIQQEKPTNDNSEDAENMKEEFDMIENSWELETEVGEKECHQEKFEVKPEIREEMCNCSELYNRIMENENANTDKESNSQKMYKKMMNDEPTATDEEKEFSTNNDSHCSCKDKIREIKEKRLSGMPTIKPKIKDRNNCTPKIEDRSLKGPISSVYVCRNDVTASIYDPQNQSENSGSSLKVIMCPNLKTRSSYQSLQDDRSKVTFKPSMPEVNNKCTVLPQAQKCRCGATEAYEIYARSARVTCSKRHACSNEEQISEISEADSSVKCISLEEVHTNCLLQISKHRERSPCSFSCHKSTYEIHEQAGRPCNGYACEAIGYDADSLACLTENERSSISLCACCRRCRLKQNSSNSLCACCKRCSMKQRREKS